MANRYMKPVLGSFDTARVIIDGYFSVVDSVGTPSALSGGGLTSITRNSAGNYSLLLSDQYYSFLSGSFSTVMPSGLVSLTPTIISNDVTTAKKVNFVFLNTSGVAVELPPQAGVYFNFELKNSIIKRGA